MTNDLDKPLHPRERAIRHACKAWMCQYKPVPGELFAMVKEGMVVAFADGQTHNRELSQAKTLTVPFDRFVALANFAKASYLPAYIVAMFTDYAIHVSTDLIKRPLALTETPMGLQLVVPTALCSKVVMEARF